MKEIIRLGEATDLTCIVELYNEVTLDLLAKGINQWKYPWDSSHVKKEIINKKIFVLENNDWIIGAFSISNTSGLEHLQINRNNKYLSKIALLPKFQGKGFGAKILKFAISYANDEGTNLYLDCWAGNSKLQDFYRENGLVHIGDFPENDYYISIFKY
jgi:GNAT superfamily N-acetyltransferase